MNDSFGVGDDDFFGMGDVDGAWSIAGAVIPWWSSPAPPYPLARPAPWNAPKEPPTNLVPGSTPTTSGHRRLRSEFLAYSFNLP